MFLSKNNNLKWKWIVAATGITILAVMFFIKYLDIPVHNFFVNFDCHVMKIIDVLFMTKSWIAISFLTFVTIFIIMKITDGKNKTGGGKAIKIPEKSKDKNTILRLCMNGWHKMVFFIEKSGLNRIVFIKDFNGKDIIAKVGSAAFCVFASAASTAMIVAIFKFAFGRMRPIFYDALGAYGFVPGSSGWALNSFPSGHAAAAFAGFVMIGLLFPRIKSITWTAAILVGISRICIGAHWPSDILAGAFIGMVMADIVKWFLMKVSLNK